MRSTARLSSNTSGDGLQVINALLEHLDGSSANRLVRDLEEGLGHKKPKLLEISVGRCRAPSGKLPNGLM